MANRKQKAKSLQFVNYSQPKTPQDRASARINWFSKNFTGTTGGMVSVIKPNGQTTTAYDNTGEIKESKSSLCLNGNKNRAKKTKNNTNPVVSSTASSIKKPRRAKPRNRNAQHRVLTSSNSTVVSCASSLAIPSNIPSMSSQVRSVTCVLNHNMISVQNWPLNIRSFTRNNYNLRPTDYPYFGPQQLRYDLLCGRIIPYNTNLTPRPIPFDSIAALTSWQQLQLETMRMSLNDVNQLLDYPGTAYVIDTNGRVVWSKEWDIIHNENVYNPPGLVMGITSDELVRKLSEILTYLPLECVGETAKPVNLNSDGSFCRKIRYHCTCIMVDGKPRGYLMILSLVDPESVNSHLKSSVRVGELVGRSVPVRQYLMKVQ